MVIKMFELNKIYNLDCLEGLKQLEDNSIDAIVSDPPYQLTSMTHTRTDPIAVERIKSYEKQRFL